MQCRKTSREKFLGIIMLYADDLIVADKTTTGAQTKFTKWQKELESKGLKINTSKTETMVCSRTEEALVIVDRDGNTLKQVEEFKYLGSIMQAAVSKMSKIGLKQLGRSGEI